MAHLVVGTAGHIDHGKSALVEALTGIHPDRLQEEKRRGITIDLGFAELDLGAGRTLSFVDVPGHERFVRHMVAGATGVDAVLLVIAADQGVRPQTREHFDICRLLDIGNGVIVLTKCDLAPDDLRQVVDLEVRELVAGSFLERASVVAVSARTGDGIAELRLALGTLFERIPPRGAAGVARLPVDRSFVLKGFGTVVTGTLVSGRLVAAQEVEVLPGGRRARIRGLQVHGRTVAAAETGQRTAVNLQGLDCAGAPRGATITTPGSLGTTRRAWARLTLLAHAPDEIKKGGPVRFHHGTTDLAARLRVVGVGADGTRFVELRLAQAAVLAPGDRFIVRRPAPVDTVGGGVIVDAHPPRARDLAVEAFAPENLEPEVALRRRIERAAGAGVVAAEAARELGLAQVAVESTLERLSASGAAVRAGSRWFDGERWRGLSCAAIEAVAEFHAASPLAAGVSREVLRGRLAPRMPQEAWRELLERLESSGALSLDGETVARVGHEVVLSGAELALARRLEQRYQSAGLEPPELEDCLEPGEAANARAVVEQLIVRGRLVRIQGGGLYHREALDRLRELLRDYARSSPTIDVAAFKKLARVTRKHAIPLLEQLDAERTTRRVGNLREILATRR